MATTPSALTVQLLAWIAERPRTYGETMDAWRSSCPRLTIWEDALDDRLVVVRSVPGAGQVGAAVTLTAAGQTLLGTTSAPRSRELSTLSR